MEILTSTEFISNGMSFPPTVSKERLKKYANNSSRYKNKYSENKISVLTSDGTHTVIINKSPINYYKLVTDKTLGLLLNEKPKIDFDNDLHYGELSVMINNTNFYTALQDMVRTFSSHGDGVIYLYKNEYGEPELSAFDPSLYFKVVDRNNINKVICYMLCQPIYNEMYINGIYNNDVKYLRVLYHYKGYYIERYFMYNGSTVGKPIEFVSSNITIPEDGLRIETGLSDFGVFDFNNSKPIDECYGISDYDAFDKLLELKEKKIAQLDGVTDKHFDPMIQGPHSAMSEDESTGEVVFRGLGGFIPLTGDDKDVKYVSWDAKTEAISSLINNLSDEIATLSEMGKVFLYGEYGNVSGEALKTMIKSALDKVSRLIDQIEPTLKRLLVQMAFIKGISIKPSDINIQWQDGITETDYIKAQTVKLLSDGAVMSKGSLLQKYYGYTDEQVKKELNLESTE